MSPAQTPPPELKEEYFLNVYVSLVPSLVDSWSHQFLDPQG